jgi:hypothetical protein
MSLPPKGKGRKSNIEAYRDAMAIVKLVDHDCMEVEDAAKALGLKLSTAYRLLSRARSMLLTPQIEADKKAAEPMVNQWFEVDPNLTTEGVVGPQVKDLPDISSTAGVGTRTGNDGPPPVVEREFITLPDGTKRRVKPQEPTADIYEWSHVMDYSSFRVKTPWRQAQLIAQWKENEALGGKYVNLRGKPQTGLPCFGACPKGNCTCHNREDF